MNRGGGGQRKRLVDDAVGSDRQLKDGCFGVQLEDDEEEIKAACQGPEQGFSGRFRDDLTGQVLHDETVLKARMVELEFFHSKGVWIKVPVSDARRTTGRAPISVRWVDVNKGDDANRHPETRFHSGNSLCDEHRSDG